jgi:uncharacterized protein (DUF2384 family)
MPRLNDASYGIAKSPNAPAIVNEAHSAYALILQEVVEIFGSEERAKTWLETPLPAFKMVTPKEVLLKFNGSNEVRNVLGQIAHGFY